MKSIDGQKLTLPILTPADLWQQTGRLETASTELMRTFDRHEKQQLLSPVRIGNLSIFRHEIILNN